MLQFLYPSRLWSFVVQARGTHLRLVGCGKLSLSPFGGPHFFYFFFIHIPIWSSSTAPAAVQYHHQHQSHQHQHQKLATAQVPAPAANAGRTLSRTCSLSPDRAKTFTGSHESRSNRCSRRPCLHPQWRRSAGSPASSSCACCWRTCWTASSCGCSL